ncbi:MAG TPA: hypothetical protein VH298_00305, partial [Jatrophihabitans sp.]|nr:hypothetical protein [Jatrophihabitans sp.]
QVAEVDGHDLAQLSEVLHRLPLSPGRPSCVIARTEKGHGLTFTSNTHTWHYGRFSQQQYQQALTELAAAEGGPR